ARVAVGADRAGIELGALFLVAQNVIGPGNLLEPLLSGGIARMLVGMMLLGQRAERLLDVRLAGVLGNAEGFVRIVHGSILPLSQYRRGSGCCQSGLGRIG